ncbi:sulfur carrier protein ThiS [Spirochaetota bacterium]
MNIRLNGEDVDFNGSNVHDVIIFYKLKPESVVVEKNGEIVHREKYAEENIKDGDVIEIVRFVGGG